MPERVHSELRAAVLEGVYLKNVERGDSTYIRSSARGCLWFGININTDFVVNIEVATNMNAS